MILAIIQARTSSSRLPNKVLKPILGKEMLLHQIDRVKKSKLINKVVVATSDELADKAIVSLCQNNKIDVFAGSLNNVLDRFYQCAKQYQPTHIVRLTADCPVIDWQIIDKTINAHLVGKFDYTSNGVQATYPDGLDVEVLTNKALSTAFNQATTNSQKEHVTLYINDNTKRFNIGYVKGDIDLSHLRWTVDEPEDFILVEKIYQNLYLENPNFLTNDILQLLDKKPELLEINQQFERNEGLKISLAKEKV